MQYTLRQVPQAVDRSLRQKARESGESLNSVILDALARATDANDPASGYEDLDPLIGTWEDDAGFDEALQAFDRIDSELWK